MANVYEMRLPRKHDRRYKLTEQQEKEIKLLREEGLTLIAIAKRYNVSQSTISLITNPLIKQKRVEYHKTYVQKILPKDIRNKRMRELRQRKRDLYREGEMG